MVPMTKEEYEKQQSIIRRVYDPDTGRNRFVISVFTLLGFGGLKSNINP